ncbi:hypothetical protein HK405_004147 [Cladochytrium tenue]|nr:hypothetical protein HK405_004147 [Cladochytrium tenue]
MVAYGEFRSAFQNDSDDRRIVLYGLRYIIETYVAKQWKLEDVENAELFFATHKAGGVDGAGDKFPFPKDLFLKKAMEVLLDCYGSGVCACVMDSYDFTNALERVLPSVKAKKVDKGGFLVLRPDSGDPVKVVLQALRAAAEVFGTKKNSRGKLVIDGASVIQGDGIDIHKIQEILDAVIEAGFAASNVAFGMGGGLLQKLYKVYPVDSHVENEMETIYDGTKGIKSPKGKPWPTFSEDA